ncbi:MAG: hypothetical protein ABIR57_08830, partial [Aeromicrobium sp.]
MKTKTFRAVILGGIIVIGAPLCLAAPSSADSNPGAAAASVSASSQAASVKYWTPKRLQSAIPGDRLLVGRTIAQVVGKVKAGLPQAIGGS